MIWRRKKKTIVPEHQKPSIRPVIDLTCPVNDADEVELVSILTSIVASGVKPDASFNVKSVRTVDVDKEAAVILCGAVCAQDRPDSQFRLVSIRQEGEDLC